MLLKELELTPVPGEEWKRGKKYTCVCVALKITMIIAYLVYGRDSLDTLFNFLHKVEDEELNRRNIVKGIEK